MYRIQKTDIFEKWFTKLRDTCGKGKILARLKRAELGNLGDYKALGEHLFEMRIAYGPGYRLYFYRKENITIVITNGGDKSTQEKDILKARQILKELGV
jgi:putative addiction module killer protein